MINSPISTCSSIWTDLQQRESEPLQLGHNRQTLEERKWCRRGNLFLICGQTSHFVSPQQKPEFTNRWMTTGEPHLLTTLPQPKPLFHAKVHLPLSPSLTLGQTSASLTRSSPVSLEWAGFLSFRPSLLALSLQSTAIGQLE